MFLKQLSEAFGVSGAEGEVRDILKQELAKTGISGLILGISLLKNS